MDNITAAFACGEPPSGSKDPYGLRRAAAGMVAIAAEHGLRYDVEKLVERAYDGLEKFPGLVRGERWYPKPTAFILERLAKALTDDGIARDIGGRSAPHLARSSRSACPGGGPAGLPVWSPPGMTW